MFGGMAYKIGILAKKTSGGGGGDVTPNAVDWFGVYYDGFIGSFFCTQRQITGITTPITLRAESTTVDGVYVYVSNTANVIVGGDDTVQQDPSFLGMTYLAPDDTFVVSNNQYVTFAATGNNFITTITIKNTSDGNAVLDTFNSDCVDC